MRISDWSSDVCSSDLDHYRRDIVEPLRGTSAALGLTLGDIVDDDLSLYPDINAVTSSLNVPWLHVAGNHDMDTDAKDDADALQTFRRHFGPDTFAREEALATFVLLDDVIHRPGMKPAYRSEEHTSELQSLMRISYAVFCLKKKIQK